MRFNLKKYINIILNASIIIVIAFGIFARFYAAKNGVGFYHDDIMLMKQIASFSYLDLLTKTMEDSQVSPPAYRFNS